MHYACVIRKHQCRLLHYCGALQPLVVHSPVQHTLAALSRCGVFLGDAQCICLTIIIVNVVNMPIAM